MSCNIMVLWFPIFVLFSLINDVQYLLIPMVYVMEDYIKVSHQSGGPGLDDISLEPRAAPGNYKKLLPARPTSRGGHYWNFRNHVR